jgi:hypothetical protein
VSLFFSLLYSIPTPYPGPTSPYPPLRLKSLSHRPSTLRTSHPIPRRVRSTTATSSSSSRTQTHQPRSRCRKSSLTNERTSTCEPSVHTTVWMALRAAQRTCGVRSGARMFVKQLGECLSLFWAKALVFNDDCSWRGAQVRQAAQAGPVCGGQEDVEVYGRVMSFILRTACSSIIISSRVFPRMT